MKQGQSIQTIATELDRQARSKRDWVAPDRSLHLAYYLPDGTEPAKGGPGRAEVALLLRGIGHFALRPLAHRQLAERVGVPAKYYDRMLKEAPELLAENVNHWLAERPDKALVRVLDDEVRALLTNGYRPLDNLDLIEAVLPTFERVGATLVSSEVTETRFYLKAICRGMSYDLKVAKDGKQVGDVVQAGVIVSNSEVGAGSLKVEPFLYTLSCKNGAVAADHALRKFHVGKRLDLGDLLPEEFISTESRRADDVAFWLKVRDVVRAAFDQELFTRLAKRLEATNGQEITKDPVEVVEVTAKRWDLNEGEERAVLRHLLSGGCLTQYGLLNAVTRASQDVDSYDRATELERLGGELLELTSSDWKQLAVKGGR